MPEDYSTIPSAAFGPLGRPHQKELRFWRLIEERTPESDGSERVELACGHGYTCLVPYPDTQEYAYCSQCVQKCLEAERKEPYANQQT